MLLVVEGEGGFVVFGSKEHHGVAAHVGFAFLFLGVDFALDAEVGLAVAVVAVEGGVEDEGEVLDGVVLEGAAELFDTEEARGEARAVFLAEDDVVVDGVVGLVFLAAAEEFASAAVLRVEGLDVVGLDVVGHQVGGTVEVGESETGIVDEEVGEGCCLVAVLHGYGLAEVGEPVDALVEDFFLRGVVEHFDLAFGHAERANKVALQHVAVVGGVGHLRHEGASVVLVGDDEHVGVAVLDVRLADVVVHIFVHALVGNAALEDLALDIEDADFDARAAVVVHVGGVLI